MRLDRVWIYGDQLSFLIPHEWVEDEEKSDHFLYSAPNADSGWLRVSFITLRDSKTNSREMLRELLKESADEKSGELYQSGANIVVAWQQMSEEDGVLICNYWWMVGHFCNPQFSQEALFSYTVLRERCDDLETQETVSLIAKLVGEAKFSEAKIS